MNVFGHDYTTWFQHYKPLRGSTKLQIQQSSCKKKNRHVKQKKTKSFLTPTAARALTRAIYLQRLPRWRRARKAWWSEIKCGQKHRKDPPERTNGLLVRSNGSEWRQESGSSFSPPHTHITFVSSTSRELSLPVRSSLLRYIYSTR